MAPDVSVRVATKPSAAEKAAKSHSSRRSSRCLIEPSDKFDFSVFGKGMPLNPKNELLLAHLRGDEDFEDQLVEYHNRMKAKKPKADPKSISARRRAR